MITNYSAIPTALLATTADAIRYRTQSLLWLAAIYLHTVVVLVGLLPPWSLVLSMVVFVVRWMLSTHELLHLRSACEVDPITRLLPLLLTPLQLGYREYRVIHFRHHRYMATPQDPEYFQLRGGKLRGFINAMSAPEQSYFRWITQQGLDAQLLRGTLMRLVLFVALVGASGLTFFWYWVPLRFAYGVSYFSFFYCLHRRGEAYGVYPQKFSPGTARLFALLFGRDSLMATCHHDIHHAHPHIAARHLAATRNVLLR
ncbi:fatty acid desaturase [Nitrosomonas sp. Nm33]|uniref:fatty acid desaturase n=1 Tax=Nitrosomonas sp. Nm33 TaxID=133724 RepID=UPI00089B1C3D|nr:fatty acid desaturase [Nitrosomonas sp. Nm33]SDZ07905.1 Fatty acid desaturase [Nitrosomonas sp. Nm33]